MMSISNQLSEHFKSVFFGGNWSAINLDETLKDITYKEAVKHYKGANSIAELTFHVTYYIGVLHDVLTEGKIRGTDADSWKLPEVDSITDWEELKVICIEKVEDVSDLLSELPEDKLLTNFTSSKYGSYYRNIAGIIEHTHYHLGQINLLKALIRNTD